MDPILSSLKGPEFRLDQTPKVGGVADAGGGGFGGALSNSLAKLDEMHASADSQVTALATGKTEDIAAVATEIERASLAMQLAVQVRNKTVDAYHELFRMPV
jgi:flagellar hook-basal body complex protein FliE